MLRTWLYFLAFLFIGATKLANAAEIKYEIQGLGDKLVLITLSGSLGRDVTTNLGADGKSIRVSAVGSHFIDSSLSPFPPLIESATIVKRGSITDLVVLLRERCSLKASPSGTSLRLLIESMPGAAVAKPEVTPPVTSADLATRTLPLKIVKSVEEAKKSGSDPGSLIIVFPDSKRFGGELGLSTELRQLAYQIDLLWGWISGNQITEESCHSNNENLAVEELENLVEALTSELQKVRKESHHE